MLGEGALEKETSKRAKGGPKEGGLNIGQHEGSNM